jgi:hypothetical protein
MNVFTLSSLRDLVEQHPERYRWFHASCLCSANRKHTFFVEDLGDQCVRVRTASPHCDLSPRRNPVFSVELFDGASSYEQAHAWLLQALEAVEPLSARRSALI